MEEFFAKKGSSFHQIVENPDRQQAKRQKAQPKSHPEVPEGTEGDAAKGEKENHTAEKKPQLIDPQLPGGGTEGENKEGRGQCQTIKHIQHGGEKGAAALPQRPQQIIHQSRRPTQQQGLQGQAQLSETVDLHAAALQPKNRCQRLWRASVSV